MHGRDRKSICSSKAEASALLQVPYSSTSTTNNLSMQDLKLLIYKLYYLRLMANGDSVRKNGDTYRIKREIAAMNFVRKNTTIPVPKVLEVEVNEDRSSFVMERVAGLALEQTWSDMTEDAKQTTITQLQGFFKQLRSIRPPEPGFIGSCDDGPAYAHRIDNRSQCGPFDSMSSFNDFLVAPVKNCPRPERAVEYRKRLSNSYEICFTHADIGYDHIIVDPHTGKVMGIIDWEMAGFWPEWWEYRKALYTSRQHTRWWIDLVRSILPYYQDELELDSELECY